MDMMAQIDISLGATKFLYQMDIFTLSPLRPIDHATRGINPHPHLPALPHTNIANITTATPPTISSRTTPVTPPAITSSARTTTMILK